MTVKPSGVGGKYCATAVPAHRAAATVTRSTIVAEDEVKKKSRWRIWGSGSRGPVEQRSADKLPLWGSSQLPQITTTDPELLVLFCFDYYIIKP